MDASEQVKPADEGRRSSEGLGLAPERAQPRAWAIFLDNGNARMWSTLQPHVQKLADAEGLEVTPLYDQAALDAAVDSERERCATLCRRVAQETRNTEVARIAGRMLANWISTGNPMCTDPDPDPRAGMIAGDALAGGA